MYLDKLYNVATFCVDLVLRDNFIKLTALPNLDVLTIGHGNMGIWATVIGAHYPINSETTMASRGEVML